MRKTIAILLGAMLALALAGCAGGQAPSGDPSSAASFESTASQPAQAGAGQVASAGAADSSHTGAYEFSTREIWVDNDGERIYGVAYVPDGVERAPLVVFAHELGYDHTAGIPYAEVLASHGYAAYTFDFRGGSTSGNRSDGASTGMSVMTEASDLEAVVDAAKGWDFVDPARVAVLGGSQGGCVSAVYAAGHPDDIAGLALLYPALSIYDDVHAQFASLDEVPDTYGLFGGWMTVGRNYAADMWDYDPFDHIAGYGGKVLILHGDADSTVDVSYSRRAADAYPDCELHIIAGAGHGFSGSAFDDACGYLLDYLDGVLGGGGQAGAAGSGSGSADEGGAASTVAMRVNGASFTVTLADTEAASALAGLLEGGPVTVEMHSYGGFEKVGPLPQALPESDEQITTAPGDVMLYQGDQITVFYGSNTWDYTPLGHIEDATADDLLAAFGDGDVTVELSL